MKKLLMMAALVCVSILGMAQATGTDSTMKVKHGGKHHGNMHKDSKEKGEKVKQVANAAGYGCPKCFSTAKLGGACAHDQTEMVQLGTYYCEKCVKATGDKPGNCSNCSGKTTRMTRKLCAQKNGKAEMKKAA